MEKDVLVNSLLDAFDTANKGEFFEKMKLSFKGENLLLALLSELGGSATPSQLMEKADFTAGRLTAIAKNLESKGLVTRLQSLEDKRSTVIEMTSEGKFRSGEIKKEIVSNIFNVIERLGEKDALEFVRILKRVAEISPEPIKSNEEVNVKI